ncbi:hypothetical protein [uncultured Thermomonospora sp.]|uniref:hypothetical protein n=2 Tax=Thermomonosporaceae TaxID=2012 RepID=UPI00259BE546|nr:hypothetical protein [uncultured Thermomonospora sp.]
MSIRSSTMAGTWEAQRVQVTGLGQAHPGDGGFGRGAGDLPDLDSKAAMEEVLMMTPRSPSSGSLTFMRAAAGRLMLKAATVSRPSTAPRAKTRALPPRAAVGSCPERAIAIL